MLLKKWVIDCLIHLCCFFYLTVVLVAVSAILGTMQVAVTHPNTGEEVVVQNLLSKDGLRYILANTLTNFTGFAPLGLVLTMMLGIGLSEKVGLFSALMTKAITKTPKKDCDIHGRVHWYFR